MNLVLLHMKENPEADIEDSIAYVREILDEKKKELLQHVLMDDFIDLPKVCKHLHLSCLKVFQMFFNSTNLFDSNKELLQDIMKAIYVPLEYRTSRPLTSVHELRPKKGKPIIYSRFDQTSFKVHHGNRRFIRSQWFPKSTMSRDGCEKVLIPPKLNLCFI
uniref:Uncharacterized protein n=1 Tax=Davidia involucrata TaxID=16924 RepID=A0A5B7ASI2_DAVIN